MPAELQVGMLVTAITALAGVVTKLWLTLEKRTEAQTAAATETVRSAVEMKNQLVTLEQRMGELASDIREDLAHLASDQDQTRSNVQRHHSEHGAILQEIRATLIERRRLRHDPLGEAAEDALPHLHTRGEGE